MKDNIYSVKVAFYAFALVSQVFLSANTDKLKANYLIVYKRKLNSICLVVDHTESVITWQHSSRMHTAHLETQFQLPPPDVTWGRG